MSRIDATRNIRFLLLPDNFEPVSFGSVDATALLPTFTKEAAFGFPVRVCTLHEGWCRVR